MLVRVLVPVQPRGVQDVDSAHVAAVVRLAPAEGAGNTCGGEGQGGEQGGVLGAGRVCYLPAARRLSPGIGADGAIGIPSVKHGTRCG